MTLTCAVTIAKVLGRTLQCVCVVPDLGVPTTGYVAIPRVRHRRDVHIMKHIKVCVSLCVCLRADWTLWLCWV